MKALVIDTQEHPRNSDKVCVAHNSEDIDILLKKLVELSPAQ